MKFGLEMTLLLISLQACVAGENPTDTQADPALDVLLESAFRAAADRLVSGKATGTYQRLERRQPTEEWKLAEEATVTIEFDRPRYCIDLKYQVNRKGQTRRVIVYDSSALSTSRFSEKTSKTGCQAEVFPSKTGTDAPVNPTVADFPWDMAQSAGHVANPIKIFESHPEYRSMLSRNDNQDIVMHVEAKGYTINALFAKEYGYNPTDVVVQVDGRPEPTQHRAAKWAFADGIWHVTSLISEFVPSNLDDDFASRSNLELNEFEINPEVSGDRFTLAALDLPGGTRIIDHRPETDSERRVLYNPMNDAELATHLDRIADQLNKLPSRSIIPPAAIVKPINGFRLSWAVVNFVALVVIVFLLVGKRRAKTD